jgi:hypothetical protein
LFAFEQQITQSLDPIFPIPRFLTLREGNAVERALGISVGSATSVPLQRNAAQHHVDMLRLLHRGHKFVLLLFYFFLVFFFFGSTVAFVVVDWGVFFLSIHRETVWNADFVIQSVGSRAFVPQMISAMKEEVRINSQREPLIEWATETLVIDIEQQ